MHLCILVSVIEQTICVSGNISNIFLSKNKLEIIQFFCITVFDYRKWKYCPPKPHDICFDGSCEGELG